MTDEIFYTIALTMAYNIGPSNAKKLIAYCGSPEAVFKEKNKVLDRIPGVGKMTLKHLRAPDVFKRTEQELKFIENNAIRVLTYTDKLYPERLKICADSPVLLYIKGNKLPEMKKMIAIVGTRQMTSYGKYMCQKLIKELSFTDIGIVSGMAYGVDTAAHKYSIEYDISTFAVLGTGLAHVYPSSNTQLAREIQTNGCLLTEFYSDLGPDRANFPQRNRIIAGLSDAVLVVEAARKGGALITADIADSYHRTVMALPGRAMDHYSIGANELIKSNKAVMVESAQDIIECMNWDGKLDDRHIQQKLFDINDYTEQEQLIIKLIGENEEIDLEEMVLKTEIPPSRLSTILLKLELAGVVKCLPGNSYILILNYW